MLNLNTVGASSASTFSPPVNLEQTLMDQSQKITQDIKDKKTANEIIQELDQFKDNIIKSKNADDLGKLKEKIPAMKTAADAWEDTTNHEASAREKKLIESRILGCQFAISQTRLNLGTHDPQDLKDVIEVLQKLQTTIDQVSGAGAQFNELTEELKSQKKEYDDRFNTILTQYIDLLTQLQNDHKNDFKSSLLDGKPDSGKIWADTLLELPNGIDVLCDSIKEIYNLKILKAIIFFINKYNKEQKVYQKLTSNDVYQKLTSCVKVMEFKKEMLPNDADFSPKPGLKRLFYESLSSAPPFSDEYNYEIYVGTIENVPEIKLKTAKNLSIFAHKIIVPEGGMTIEVSGKDGEAHANPKANNSTNPNQPGEKGKDGNNGLNGGDLLFTFGSVELKGAGKLNVKLVGGNGNNGQDGGDGYSQGAFVVPNPLNFFPGGPSLFPEGAPRDLKNAKAENILLNIPDVAYILAFPGKPISNPPYQGGEGGKRGEGGKNGDYTLCGFAEDLERIKPESINGSDGIKGIRGYQGGVETNFYFVRAEKIKWCPMWSVKDLPHIDFFAVSHGKLVERLNHDYAEEFRKLVGKSEFINERGQLKHRPDGQV